jgi:hypothetical protein
MSRFCDLVVFVFVAVAVTACSTEPADDLPEMQPDASVPMHEVDAAVVVQMLNPSDCDAFAANAASAQNACGADVSAAEKAALATACKKGIESASLCGGNPAAGMDCFRSPDPSDWVCQLGTVLPSCNADLEAALGMYCLVKLGDPRCASIACDDSLDCPSGSSCNDATGKCFSQSANCVGLPCESSLDCPQGEICNSAEHACIKN